MDSENKKISFSFSKSSKKQNIFGKSVNKEKKVQLIECLEAQTIKIKDDKKEVKGPLIIPMVQSTFNILDRRREIKSDTANETINEIPDCELTVDELAARELIREAQCNSIQNPSKVFVLPTSTENVLQIEGKEEPTLEDYDAVPITDYGLAMLRGMGWKEGSGIGKNNKKIKMSEPQLRPKGMGLGASHSYNDKKTKPALDKNGKEITLSKGSYAKIIDGKKKGCYCEVQGFDDEAGRIIVKTSLDGLILSLNEFLVTPVTKEEYDKSSKVINIVKYEEYKDKIGSGNSSTIKHEMVLKTSEDDRQKKLISKYKHSNKSRKYRSSSTSEDEREHVRRKNKKEHRRSSSSDYEDKKHKYKKKSYKHKNSSDSESDYKYNYKRDKSSSHKHGYKRR